jgi:hypothetical protein
MNLRPDQHIDLTGRLSSLKSSLTPAYRRFESTRPLWQLPQRSEPAHVIWSLFWSWLATTLVGILLLWLLLGR